MSDPIDLPPHDAIEVSMQRCNLSDIGVRIVNRANCRMIGEYWLTNQVGCAHELLIRVTLKGVTIEQGA